MTGRIFLRDTTFPLYEVLCSLCHVEGTAKSVQGLHVKMDLSTGRKQAKTMAAKEQSTSMAVAIDPASGSVLPESSSGSPTKPAQVKDTDVVDDMVRILQALPEPDESFTSLLQRRDSLSRVELAERMRALWEARQAMLKDAMSSAKTEAQQMQEVLSQLIERSPDVGNVLDTLDDLTYFVTKKDNAVDFAGMGGLEAVAYLLNDTLPAVRAAASITLGTCVKYEPLLQQRAVALGVLPVLSANLREAAQGMQHAMAALRTHDTDTATTTKVFKECSELASRSVFALGAMCRGAPHILQQLLAAEGPQLWHQALALMTPAALGETMETTVWSEQSQMWHTQSGAVKAAALRLGGKLAAFLGDMFAETHYQELQLPERDPQEEVVMEGTVPITPLHESAQEREAHEQAMAAVAAAAAADTVAARSPATGRAAVGALDVPGAAGLFGDESCAVLAQALSVCLGARESLDVDVAEKLLTTAAFSTGATHQALHSDAPEVDAASVAAWSDAAKTAQHQCSMHASAPWADSLRQHLDAVQARQDAFPNAQLVLRAANFIRAQL